MGKNSNSFDKGILIASGALILIVVAIIEIYLGEQNTRKEEQNIRKREESMEGIQITYYKCSYCSTEIRRDTTNIKLSKPAQTPTDKEIHKDNYSEIHYHCKEPYALSLTNDAKSYIKKKEYVKVIRVCKEIEDLSKEVYEKNKLQDIKSKAYSELYNIQMAKTKEQRELYASRLRESYLDRQMDIKVKAFGTHNEYLSLTYILFNDVWVHEFKKGSLIEEIEDQGFECVMFSDGYRYVETIEFKKTVSLED